MSDMVFQITSFTIVYSIIYSGADQRKHQSSASLAFVRGIHRWPVNSPHKGPVTRKRFPFDDVIMEKWLDDVIIIYIGQVFLILSSAKYQRASLVISQHWFRQWVGAIRHPAITWACVDPDLCRYMASLGHNVLINDLHTHNMMLRNTDSSKCLSYNWPTTD